MIDRRGISMTDEGVFIKCPICGKVERLNLTSEEYGKLYFAIDTGEGLIQEILPERTAPERELCCTNYCYDCQKKIFGKPTEKEMKELREKNSGEAYKKQYETEGILYVIHTDGTIEKTEKKGMATDVVLQELAVTCLTAWRLHAPEESDKVYFMLTDEYASSKKDIKPNPTAAEMVRESVMGDVALVKLNYGGHDSFDFLDSSDIEELETKFACLKKEAVS